MTVVIADVLFLFSVLFSVFRTLMQVFSRVLPGPRRENFERALSMLNTAQYSRVTCL